MGKQDPTLPSSLRDASDSDPPAPLLLERPVRSGKQKLNQKSQPLSAHLVGRGREEEGSGGT